MTLISFDDAVTAANLNPNQEYAVFYADGRFANRTAVAARCPKAKLYGITVRGLTGHGIFACDCEAGDLTVQGALRWAEEQIKLKVELICVYASLDTWENQGLLTAIQALEKKYGVRIRKWVAHFNNIAQIPSWADADQYADPGPVDHDIALATFFSDLPKPPDHNHGKARALVTYDLATGRVTGVHGIPGLGVHFGGPAKEVDIHVKLAVGKGGGHWSGS